jgi:hypothetical protein
MTSSSQHPVPPVVPSLLGDDGDRDDQRDSDRDSDGTPVGRADQRADVERSGGDPDDV